MSNILLTPAEAKASLNRRGISVSSWAKQYNLSEAIVHGVLRGRLQGNRGQAHKAAVLLGMKDGTIVE